MVSSSTFLEKGDRIVTAGESSLFLFIVVSGSVQLSASSADYSNSLVFTTNGTVANSPREYDSDGKYMLYVHLKVYF